MRRTSRKSVWRRSANSGSFLTNGTMTVIPRTWTSWRRRCRSKERYEISPQKQLVGNEWLIDFFFFYPASAQQGGVWEYGWWRESAVWRLPARNVHQSGDLLCTMRVCQQLRSPLSRYPRRPGLWWEQCWVPTGRYVSGPTYANIRAVHISPANEFDLNFDDVNTHAAHAQLRYKPFL